MGKFSESTTHTRGENRLAKLNNVSELIRSVKHEIQIY